MKGNEIKQKAISGVFWQTIQRFGSRIILFVANMIFARLLSPDDFGVMGIIWVFISFSDIFINGGFLSALIQKKDVNEDDYSTAFYWNIVIAILCYITIYISAPFISKFYNNSILLDVLRVQGIVLFLNALTIVQSSRIQRQLRFKKLAIIDIIASVLGSLLGIFAAVFFNFGVWSLVIKMVSYSTITCIAFWTTERWYPKRRFSWPSFKKLFSFGSFMLLSSLTNVLYINFQPLIIGKLFSPKDLGYFSQARKLEEIPVVALTNIVSTVSFPIFSKLQDNKEQLVNYLKKNIRSITFLSFPMMVFLMVFAKQIIIILFTDVWIESVPYFQLLCLSGILIPVNIANRDLYASIGKSKLYFNSQLIYKILGIILMLIGVFNYGIIGLIFGRIIADCFLFIMNALISGRLVGYGLVSQVKDIIPNMLNAVVCGILLYYMAILFNISSLWSILLYGVIFLLIYIIIAFLSKSQELKLYLSIIHNLLHRYEKK